MTTSSSSRLLFFAAVVFFVALFAICPARAQAQEEVEADEDRVLILGTGKDAGCFRCRPGTYNRTIGRAKFTLRIPKKWNRALVIYAHGYSLTVPQPEAFYDNPLRDPSTESAEEILLSRGYALAGTSYSTGGWAVKEGMADIDNLNRLIQIFFIGCWPRRTILYGVSLGSLIALKKAETRPIMWVDKFDGVVAACPMSAGATRTADLGLQYNIAYDAAFSNNGVGGWPEEWGTPQNPNPNLNFYDDVLPRIVSQLQVDSNFGYFEFQRLVSSLQIQDYYPFTATDQADIFLFTNMYFSTMAIAELNKRAGGAVAENSNPNYAISASEKAYLAYFGVNADNSLQYMNSQTYKANKTARDYLKKYADFTGLIRIPVLTMHNSVDSLVPASGNVLYREKVHENSKHNLYQVYTGSSGHCNFTPEQLVASVEAMDTWIVTKKSPTEESFPESEGFLPQTFSPGPWPYGN